MLFNIYLCEDTAYKSKKEGHRTRINYFPKDEQLLGFVVLPTDDLVDGEMFVHSLAIQTAPDKRRRSLGDARFITKVFSV